MPACGYEFYLLVFNSQRTSEISSWTLEDKIHIHARSCIILYLICMKMKTACRTHFHMKGFALRLVLKQRHKRTRKWPIKSDRLTHSIFVRTLMMGSSNLIKDWCYSTHVYVEVYEHDMELLILSWGCISVFHCNATLIGSFLSWVLTLVVSSGEFESRPWILVPYLCLVPCRPQLTDTGPGCSKPY